MGINIDEFKKERSEALLSFERQRIERYMRKYHIEIPMHENIFWAQTARAILKLADASQEAKERARGILRKYGMSEHEGRSLIYTEIW